MISGVYVITERTTGHHYVGSASHLNARWLHHRGRLRANKHRNPKLQAAWNRYGADSFIFQMVECTDRSLLLEREQSWIDRLQACGPNGFNILPTAGSHAGVKRSTETRMKIAEALRGNKNGLGNRSGSGKKWTPEMHQRMSAFMRGNRFSAGSKNHCMPHSAESRAKMSATKRAKRRQA